MKKAFTMIELIFVIVIIGILAAIAIPRLAGTSEEAKKILVMSYISTLNRTVGTTMYTSTLHSNAVGVVATAEYCGVLNVIDNPYIDPISEVPIAADCELTSNLDTAFKAGSKFTDGDASTVPKWKYTY